LDWTEWTPAKDDTGSITNNNEAVTTTIDHHDMGKLPACITTIFFSSQNLLNRLRPAFSFLCDQAHSPIVDVANWMVPISARKPATGTSKTGLNYHENQAKG
jgi:hypothetical protein